MKKSLIVLILVLVLTLTIAAPAFADPGNGKACDNVLGSGHGYGWSKNWGGEGKGWGPMIQWIGFMQACKTDTPKTPFFAH